MTEQPVPVAVVALALTDWTERWVPDAFIFAVTAMLPILGLFRLGAREVMGCTIVVFLALAPVVLIRVALQGTTLLCPL